MATQKDKIIVGNSYSVAYECLEPSVDELSTTALNPSSGYAELWDVQNGAFISLGTLGTNGVGASVTIVDNIASYTVLGTKTTVAGDYKLYVTLFFSGSRTVTEVRPLKVIGIS